jgi:hypothetical protein
LELQRITYRPMRESAASEIGLTAIIWSGVSLSGLAAQKAKRPPVKAGVCKFEDRAG